MKKAVLLLFIIGFGLGYWFIRENPQTKTIKSLVASPKENVEKPKPKMVVASPKEQTRVAASKPKDIGKQSPKTATKSSKATPLNAIPSHLDYKVINGFAIAQGDVILGKVKGAPDGKTGQFEPQKQSLWPSHIIPYAVGKDLVTKEEHIGQLEAIRKVIKYLNENTVLEMKPYHGEKDAIVFVPSDKLCASYLGQVGGLQPIYLSPSCGFQQILHEVMHALGFVHEQSRADRDQHITIHWENIAPEFWVQFAMMPQGLLHTYSGPDFSFHFDTVMMYSDTAFLKSQLVGSQARSISPKRGGEIKRVESGLSQVDINRLYYLYGR